MNLGLLKELMLFPEKEYIINKVVNIQGIEVLLLSFTIEKNKNSLWIIQRKEEDLQEIEEEINGLKLKTKRDEMLNHIEFSNINSNFFLNKVEIQGNIIEFDTSYNSYFNDNNWEGITKLLHFVEIGLIPEEWDNVDLENLVITEFKQKKDGYAPIIDTTKDLSIILYVGEYVRQVPILHSFKVKMGKEDIGKKIVYYDKELGKENYFYINGVMSYDPYEHIENVVKTIENIEERERILNDLMNAIQDYCPRNKNLAIIEYETEDNTQLEFYLKEYLDSKPMIYRHNTETGIIGRSTGIGFIVTTDKDKGVNGYKLRACVMQPIDKDFSGELEIELFSRYLIIPEEKIQVF